MAVIEFGRPRLQGSLASIRLMMAWRHWRTCRPSCESQLAGRRMRWINSPENGVRVCRFCWAVEDLPTVTPRAVQPNGEEGQP